MAKFATTTTNKVVVVECRSPCTDEAALTYGNQKNGKSQRGTAVVGKMKSTVATVFCPPARSSHKIRLEWTSLRIIPRSRPNKQPIYLTRWTRHEWSAAYNTVWLRKPCDHVSLLPLVCVTMSATKSWPSSTTPKRLCSAATNYSQVSSVRA